MIFRFSVRARGHFYGNALARKMERTFFLLTRQWHRPACGTTGRRPFPALAPRAGAAERRVGARHWLTRVLLLAWASSGDHTCLETGTRRFWVVAIQPS